jgi:hypothetical protein
MLVEINTAGDAFADFAGDAEIARLLRLVADTIEGNGADSGILRDTNGNTCGAWRR